MCCAQAKRMHPEIDGPKKAQDIEDMEANDHMVMLRTRIPAVRTASPRLTTFHLRRAGLGSVVPNRMLISLGRATMRCSNPQPIWARVPASAAKKKGPRPFTLKAMPCFKGLNASPGTPRVAPASVIASEHAPLANESARLRALVCTDGTRPGHEAHSRRAHRACRNAPTRRTLNAEASRALRTQECISRHRRGRIGATHST